MLLDQTSHNMEEDPTPIPSMGMRKSLITDAKGVITGEEVEQDLGHTESGCDIRLFQINVLKLMFICLPRAYQVRRLARLCPHLMNTSCIPGTTYIQNGALPCPLV